MKDLKQYLTERLLIKRINNKYNYFPKTKDELKRIIKELIKEEGNEVDLNDIDVSQIKDMSYLFDETDFNGDISKWDVHNVTNMSTMFYECESFNQDISKWDVHNVTNMKYMFYLCKKFNQDISEWDVSKVKNKDKMFGYCLIKEKYKPKFK